MGASPESGRAGAIGALVFLIIHMIGSTFAMKLVPMLFPLMNQMPIFVSVTPCWTTLQNFQTGLGSEMYGWPQNKTQQVSSVRALPLQHPVAQHRLWTWLSVHERPTRVNVCQFPEYRPQHFVSLNTVPSSTLRRPQSERCDSWGARHALKEGCSTVQLEMLRSSGTL